MEVFDATLGNDQSPKHDDVNSTMEAALMTTHFATFHSLSFYPPMKQKDVATTISGISPTEFFVNVFSDSSVRLFHDNNPFYIHVQMIKSFAQKYHPADKPGLPYLFLSSYETKKTFDQNDLKVQVHVVGEGKFNLQAFQQIRLEQLTNPENTNVFVDLERYCRDINP